MDFVESILQRLTPEDISDLQSLIDRAKQTPQLRQYVLQRKLHLIDSRFVIIDVLLDKGILQ